MVDTGSSQGECFMMFIGNYIMIFIGGNMITIYGDIDGWSRWFNNGLWWLVMVPFLAFIILWILMVDGNGWYWFFSWWMFCDVYWKPYHDIYGGNMITIYGDIDGWLSWLNNGLWWPITVFF